MEEYKKKYEEAMFRMNKWVEGSEIIDPKEVAEFVFPELKESESERIRKSLINFLDDVWHLGKNAYFDKYDKADCAEWIAWLKKQGEQKPIADFSDLRTWKYIVDAVLTEKEGIGQYLDSPLTEEVAKKLQKRFGNIEQKPTWSEEDKKILGKVLECIRFAEDHYQLEEGEANGMSVKMWLLDHINPQPKQEWSEEDEWKFSDILALLRGGENFHYNTPELFDWLKSLKERIGE